MKNYNEKGFVNIGIGIDISIKELTEMLVNIIDYSGNIEFDFTKPDGTPRKLMNISKISDLGWEAKVSLVDGIKKTIEEVSSNF